MILDEKNRMLLHSVMYRDVLGWEKGVSRLTANVNEGELFITLTEKEDGEIIIDELSRVKLDKNHCALLGWNTRDKISATVEEGNRIKLQMEEKYKL